MRAREQRNIGNKWNTDNIGFTFRGFFTSIRLPEISVKRQAATEGELIKDARNWIVTGLKREFG